MTNQRDAADMNADDLSGLLGLIAGSINLEDLVAEFDYPPPEYMDPDRILASAAAMSTNEKVREAVKQLTFLHETRHLHDAFGTYAGITLFLSRLEMLRQFVVCGHEMASRRQTWPIPFNGEDYERLPAEAQKFIRLAIRVLPIVRRFTGDLPSKLEDPEIAPDPLPHVATMKEELNNSLFMAFPARIMGKTEDRPQSQLESKLQSEMESRLQSKLGFNLHFKLQFIPVAFDAILEGNAQVFQRTFIERLWGKDVADQAFLYQGQTDDPFNPESRAMTYNVTDLMTARYLENKGHKSFDRQTVLALADRALSGGWFRLKNALDSTLDVEMCCVGNEYVQQLEACAPDDLVSGNIAPHPVDKGYIALRDGLSRSLNEPIPESLYDEVKDILTVRNWVTGNIILPLLDARIQTGGRILADFGCYLEYITNLRLPWVPFRVSSDGTLNYRAPVDVVAAWLRVRMISRLLRELLGGAEVLLCPRANEEVGFKGSNMAGEGHCQDYIDEDLCGRYQEGQAVDKVLPVCEFALKLVQLGFAPRLSAVAQ